MNKIITVLMILLMMTLVGCKTIDDLKKDYLREEVQPKGNETPKPEPEPKFEGIVENQTNVIFIESENQCIFIVDEKNDSTLVDCGGEDFLYAIRELKDLGYNKIDNFYYTEMQENLDVLVSKFKPDIILEKDYISFDDVLISGKCINECEDKITDEDLKILVLANSGRCPTNSLIFLVKINPEIVIANSNICKNASETIDVLGMEKLYKNKDRIQIVFNETDYEVFK